MPGNLELLLQSLVKPAPQPGNQVLSKLATIQDFVPAILTSSQYLTYPAEVLKDNPVGYWRFSDPGKPYAKIVLEDSPVGYWRLDDVVGSALGDSSTVGAVGSYTGGFTLAQVGAIVGDPDHAVLFNGSTGSATIPNNAAFNAAAFSVEAWFKSTSTASFQDIVRRDDGAGNRQFILRLEVGQLSFITLAAGGATTKSVGTSYNDGNWHHVVGTSDGTTQKIYADGVLSSSFGSTPGNPALNVGILFAQYQGGGENFNGTLDELAFYSTALTANQVLAHYNAGKNTSHRLTASSSVLDSSGFSNAGTATGFVAGTPGALTADPDTALWLDGATGYISLPNVAILNVTGSITLEAWVKTSTSASTQMVIGGFQNGGGFAGYALALTSTSKIRFNSNGGSNYDSTATVTYSDGNWHHVVASYDGTNVTFYFDGAQVGAAVAAGAPGSYSGARAIGAVSDGSGSYTNGSIDEVAIYSAALSAWRVLDHYNVGKRIYSTYKIVVLQDGPVGYWRLGETSGTSAKDQSTSMANGTYSGGYTLNQVGPLATGNDQDPATLFNGSTGYVSIADTAALRVVGDLTLEAWIKPTNFTNQNIILGKATGAVPAPYTWSLNQTTGTPSFSRGNGTVQATVFGIASSITAGTWQHVVVVMQGTTVTHYLNGVANGSGTLSTTIADAGTALDLATMVGAAASQWFNGSLDEVAIYNKALTAAQVLTHYRAALSVYQNQDAVALLDNGSNGVVARWDNPNSRWGECVWG